MGRATEERYCPSGRFSLQGRRHPYLSALGHPRPGGGRHDHGCHRAPGLHRGWRASNGLRMPVTVDRHEPTARLRALEVPSGPPAVDRHQARPGHRRRRRRRLAALGLSVALAVGGALYLNRSRGTPFQIGGGGTVRLPDLASLSPLRARIVTTAESQIGYRTDPPGTYCNKYSAFWNSGVDNCGNGNLDEEWCADFAAWVWEEAGAAVTYRFVNGDLNSSAASFYEWGVSRGTWHPVGSGYVPVPGDVAVYGLDVANLVAAHVAIVMGYQPGDRGPTAINGDGDLTAFSVVEVRADESVADTHPGSAPLAGYVSPSEGSAD